MKKYLIGFVVFSLLVMPMISAGYAWGSEVGGLKLVEKDPSDWSVVEGGGEGLLKFKMYRTFPWMTYMYQTVRVSVYNLEPKTYYQLIYYGNEEYNDVWPYATCLGDSFRTGSVGQGKSKTAKFNYVEMTLDDVDQKLWVVLADDVDCENREMIAWNPSEYLFEYNTI